MSSIQKSLYLARRGEISGPFSEDEIRSLKEKGELAHYTWIWQAFSTAWEPLDPPPAAPVEIAAIPQAQSEPRSERPALRSVPLEPQEAREPVAKAPETRFRHLENFQILLHDFRHVVTGQLIDATSSRCEIESPESDSGFQLGSGAPIWLNILDSKTGRCIDIRARLNQIVRRNDRWVYSVVYRQDPSHFFNL